MDYYEIKCCEETLETATNVHKSNRVHIYNDNRRSVEIHLVGENNYSFTLGSRFSIDIFKAHNDEISSPERARVRRKIYVISVSQN